MLDYLFPVTAVFVFIICSMEFVLITVWDGIIWVYYVLFFFMPITLRDWLKWSNLGAACLEVLRVKIFDIVWNVMEYILPGN